MAPRRRSALAHHERDRREPEVVVGDMQYCFRYGKSLVAERVKTDIYLPIYLSSLSAIERFL